MIAPNIDCLLSNGAYRRALPAALVLILIHAGSALASDVGLVLYSATDTIYHGTPETGSEPAFATSVTWQPSERFFVGASGRVSPVGRERQRHSSYDVFLGTTWQLGHNWLSTLSVQRREFPGSPKAWQYTEYKAEVTSFDGWRFSLDYAPDYYAHDTQAAVVEVDKTTFWSDRWYWHLQAGAVALSASQLGDYHYARVGGGFTAGRFSADLSYGWNSDDGTVLFGPGPLRSPRTVVSISYRLF